jgi:hypothetical protein
LQPWSAPQTPSATASAKPAPAKAAKPAKKAAQSEYKMVLEPKAMDLLKALSAKLAAAKSMSFTAVVGYEYPSKLGPPIVYTSRYDVTMQRPDKLRVLIPGDGPASEFYYDGKVMMAYAPAENLVAIAEAPPTIDAALTEAHKSAEIFFPFSDIIAADPFGDIEKQLRVAFYVGQSKVVGGVTTDIVAYQLDHVFIQVWIGAEDKLPRMARAVFRGDPSLLRHVAEFSNWKLDAPVAADVFASAAAGKANRINFARPDPMLPAGVKPAAKPKPKPAKTP